MNYIFIYLHLYTIFNISILFLEGQIPDAALIHAARKRRQQARDLGEDFIPLSTQSHRYLCIKNKIIALFFKYSLKLLLFSEPNIDNEQVPVTTGRRLTREEDELEDSDDDGRIVMSGIVSQAEDRKKNLHITMAGNRNI